MTKVYLCDILPDFKLGKYIGAIKKILNIKINFKSSESVVGWILLIKLLLRDIDINDLYFNRNNYGKPYLNNNKKFFNISHSNKKLAIAISNKEIGIDIEFIKNPNLKIAERFFEKSEREFIFLDDDTKMIIERFYIIWTLKESYLKYKGTGLAKKLNSFEFKIDENRMPKLFLDNDKNEKCDCRFTKIGDFIFSICGDSEYKFENINLLDIL